MDLLAPVEALELVERLEGHVVRPAEQLGVHVVGLEGRRRPSRQLGAGEVLVQLRHLGQLAVVGPLVADDHRAQGDGGEHVDDGDGPRPRGAVVDEQTRGVGEQHGDDGGDGPDQRDGELRADAPPQHRGEDQGTQGEEERQRQGLVQEAAAREHHRQPEGPRPRGAGGRHEHGARDHEHGDGDGDAGEQLARDRPEAARVGRQQQHAVGPDVRDPVRRQQRAMAPSCPGHRSDRRGVGKRHARRRLRRAALEPAR